MKRSIYSTTAALLSMGLACLVTGCSRPSSADATGAPPVKVEETGGTDVIEVEHPEQFPLVTVEQRKSVDELKVNGVVAPDVSRTAPVVSLSGGRVVEIRARLGDDVKKGEVLLVIQSTDLAMALSDYHKFQADEQLARRQLERSQLLYSKGATARKDLEVAEDAARKAEVDRATAAERIRILGSSVDHPSPLIPVRAPISGTIVEQNVAGGAGVKSLDNSPNLFTIANLSRVWVLCDVYENNLAQVRVGDLADVRLNAYPDRTLRGRVSNISRVLDPATRTAKVRLELDNPQRLMRAGMFATATFRSPTGHLRPVVPATAALRLHDKDWVFRFEGGRRFRRTEIQAGPVSSDGFEEILSGVSPGDKVVANALEFSSAAVRE